VLADTVQSNIGALFGISGTAVVVIFIWLAVAGLSNSAKKGEAAALSNPTSQVCANGKHNECPGRVKLSDQSTGNCVCTCHGSTSDYCSKLGRHDLCSGGVEGLNAYCRCTCHMPRT